MADGTTGRFEIDAPELRAGITIGVAVGVPAAVGVGAFLALFRSLFDATNAALVLMIVVVAVAALGGPAAGIVTSLAAVASFDFFHTKPYLSLIIDSGDDVETAVLLLIAAVLVGTIASWGRSANRRAGSARSDVRRIHRVAEAAVNGAEATEVIAIAEDELRQLLSLHAAHFESGQTDELRALPRINRNGAVEGAPDHRFGRLASGVGGFELPEQGVELPVLARGRPIGRFLLSPTHGVAVPLEQRLVAVAIADQVAAVWLPQDHG
jgi:K+-sensing histidine kinase KdpD